MTIKERYAQLISYFEEHMPVAETELNYNTPFQLLTAVVLSAQCTDKRVNMVTPALFSAYPDAHAMAKASAEDIFKYIHSVSYPNSKSKHLSQMAQQLVADFDGQVPDRVEQLVTLPGVGRKTANVVTAVLYNQPNMPVDTHVFRVSNRIGLTNNSKTPLATEQTLTKYIPADKIPIAHHWLILHGRYVCIARNPKCAECGLTHLCRYYATKLRKKQSSNEQ